MTDLTDLPVEAVRAQKIIAELFGSAVVAVYLHGSAAFGGLRKDSDVDILAVVDCDIGEETRKALTDRLLKTSGRFGNSDGIRCLELTLVKMNDVVPWQYPPKLLYQYGEWLWDDFARGWISQTRNDPDLAITLSQARQHSVALTGIDASRLLEPIPAADLRRAMKDCLPGLLNNLKGDERNVLLTLARMWATAVTGSFLPKDKAAEWAAKRLSAECGALLCLAASAYRGEGADDWSVLSREADDLAGLLKQEIERCLESDGDGGTFSCLHY